MLTLHGITKVYETAGETVDALRGVDMCFRRQEFVSILGHSGCGKTTLLNIIGGLDQYTAGDLQIDGVSTKDYTDRDWDSYRNHRIGFVFQSYHLIPHQSVLSNVELALTLSGVSRAERRRRAEEALRRVGLADQIHKKPTQMSGGQMQRVAIARALVNNPEILLADEPTGALDTATSRQIMDLLKEVSRDRLVIMVTHNPELAEAYSTRIIRLSDGEVVSDTNPCTLEEATAHLQNKEPVAEKEAQQPAAEAQKEKPAKNGSPYKTVKRKKHQTKRQERTSMSLFSAIALSFDNLLTKKTRTFLTSFAGSIGIIGIALVLALSNGIELYIDRVEEDALSSYPITLESVTMDMAEILATMTGNSEVEEEVEDGYIYSSQAVLKMMNALIGGIRTNDLKAFKDFLENESDMDHPDVATVVYEYGITPNIWHMYEDGEGNKKPVQVNPSSVMDSVMSMTGISGGMSMALFDQLLDNESLLDAQYDLLEGEWPDAYNEVILVTDGHSQINDLFLYALGIKDPDELKTIMGDLFAGKPVETKTDKYTYAELMGQTFTLVLSGDLYADSNGDGVYEYKGKDNVYVENLLGTADKEGSRAVTLKISGIVRPKKDAAATSITGTVGYTSALVDYLLDHYSETDVVKAQMNQPQVDVLTGLPFATFGGEMPSAEEQMRQMQTILAFEGKTPEELRVNWAKWLEAKHLYLRMDDAIAKLAAHTADMSEEDRVYFKIGLFAQLFVANQSELSDIPGFDMGEMGSAMGMVDVATIVTFFQMAYDNGTMSEEEITTSLVGLLAYFGEAEMGIPTTLAEDVATAASNLAAMTDSQVLDGYEAELATLGERELTYLWQAEYGAVSGNSYAGNLRRFGCADKDNPTSILIYPVSFDQKDFVNSEISRYNGMVEDAKKIIYTDLIGVLFSSISMILNIVTYVLVAFASISLVVSSIMIGIITYISVLERTKEIGILRAVGASKRDVSRVFNAETLMIGFVAGVIGVVATVLLCLPINAIIQFLSGVSNISAKLPFTAAVLLVVISVVITVISGLIPSRMAAKKDPVEALRTD